MNKFEIRTIYKQKRQALTNSEVDEKSLAIANHTLKLPIWNRKYYHLFLSIKKLKEINTDFILHIIQGKDKETIISQSNFKDNSLKHFLLTDSTPLKVNKFGIPEPVDGIEVLVSKIDVVFVPLLAFDRSGHRIGYGQGFYDRFLKECRTSTVKIGLSFFEPLEENLKADRHDISLDYVVTPSEILSFDK